jgi:hypothetical protein
MKQSANLLERSVNWLENHRIINLLLVFAYFAFIYHMHVPMAQLSVWVMNGMSLPVYDKVVLLISALLLILFIILLSVRLYKDRSNHLLKTSYLLITVTAIIIHFRIMFEMNIEIIHIFQYSILAFILFPITRRFGAAIIFTIPFMLIDEWHQYRVLYLGYVEYFEFNDVVMDIYGCALAMLTLMIVGVRGASPVRPLWRRSEFIFLIVLLIVFVIAVRTCFIALYDADRCLNTWLVLNVIHEPVTFWRQFPGRDVIYHIMQPIEAIIFITVLIVFYFGLDSFRRERV